MYDFPFFKAERIAGTPWSYDLPTHDWIVARIGGTWHGYWFVGVPMWLFVGLLAVFNVWIWRKTRAKLKVRAFPVEVDRPVAEKGR